MGKYATDVKFSAPFTSSISDHKCDKLFTASTYDPGGNMIKPGIA